MAGAIIENMSGRKLAVLGAALLTCQVLCFLVGAVWAPAPNNSDQFLATKCYDPAGSQKSGKTWFQPRGANKCRSIESIADEAEQTSLKADNVVFSIQMPLPKNREALDYSRWQQNLIGVLTPDIEYQGDDMKERVMVVLDSRLVWAILGLTPYGVRPWPRSRPWHRRPAGRPPPAGWRGGFHRRSGP